MQQKFYASTVGGKEHTGKRRNFLVIAVSFLAGQLTEILRYWANRHDYKHLLDQPDYLLKDIGLSRLDIIAAMREETYRKAASNNQRSLDDFSSRDF
ncbi:DUF1127 domain-containing protein [uncultured Sneathiella sp.]|uniref:DUF1127 domain-containing protein n=1 Tax=uncultured Sneathiella sp. TaxID=879315 RepID=UPI0030EB297C|tara:strand:- start:3408 stop:3698 length:291 start_codon:yes stop_codon:yes gene_type:complete